MNATKPEITLDKIEECSLQLCYAKALATAERIQPLATAIRPDEPGAAGRAESFAEHCGAMRRQALMLRQRIQLLKAQEASDAA
jgi:hypothetical protein